MWSGPRSVHSLLHSHHSPPPACHMPPICVEEISVRTVFHCMPFPAQPPLTRTVLRPRTAAYDSCFGSSSPRRTDQHAFQVAVISIPPVRQKSREQLEKRQAEVQALKRRAAQHSPEADRKDDSSSGEDTSDEAFLARHQPGWEEEHRRNYAPAAGACLPELPLDAILCALGRTYSLCRLCMLSSSAACQLCSLLWICQQ